MPSRPRSKIVCIACMCVGARVCVCARGFESTMKLCVFAIAYRPVMWSIDPQNQSLSLSLFVSRSGQAIYSSSKDGYRVYMRGTSGGVNSWTMNALQHRFRVYGVGFRI